MKIIVYLWDFFWAVMLGIGFLPAILLRNVLPSDHVVNTDPDVFMDFSMTVGLMVSLFIGALWIVYG
jgi:hypothetical protein